MSAIKTLFTKIDDMADSKDLFKLTIFTRKFLLLFTELVKDKVQEKINSMQNVEDMNGVMRDLDYLKFQIVSSSRSSNSSNSSKKNQNQQPKNCKKLFHVVDRSETKKCKVVGCSESHPLWKCKEFSALTPADRYDTA
ncbi:MAG: hypothetical protein GY696_33210 [Gammaproteobacteria bacterium]|nr:hypothetical protein [Gammaproteobacteria bacterium]